MYNGFAIAIAWPETLCKQPGAWYDTPLRWVGLNKNYYYKLGHAAVVLVNEATGNCYYYDFGRYHAPHGYGRVRSEYTDHDLCIEMKAEFDDKKKNVLNTDKILAFLSEDEARHGSGKGYASSIKINFDNAYAYANAFQAKGFYKYGPFERKGSNCSRFVNNVMVAGNPSLVKKIALKSPLMLTPTTMWNIHATGTKTYRTI